MQPISITGTVEKHLGRGRTLGFPTANIAYAGAAEEGVYAARFTLDSDTPNSVTYDAVAFIGSAPTFNDHIKRLEVYIFGFDQDIYGRQAEVTLFTFLRGNVKYGSVEELIEQIHKDIQDTKEVLKTV